MSAGTCTFADTCNMASTDGYFFAYKQRSFVVRTQITKNQANAHAACIDGHSFLKRNMACRDGNSFTKRNILLSPGSKLEKTG